MSGRPRRRGLPIVILAGLLSAGMWGAAGATDLGSGIERERGAPDSPAASEGATLGERLAPLLAERPAGREDCSAAPRGPLRLPPRPGEATLGIFFADGRPARWDSLRVFGSDWYWPLEDACSALGAGLLWDPARLEGEILLDTLRCRFAVGAEVLHCGDRAIQLMARVLYLDNRLLLPVSFAPRIAAALLPERWSFVRDSLLLAERPPGPVLGRLRIQEVRARTYLRWELTGRPAAELRTDGAGHLVVDLPGVHVDPLAPPSPEQRSGACLREIWPHPGGTRFAFALGEDVVGWRTEWRGDRGEYRVILTTDRADLSGWQAYEPWIGEPAFSERGPDSGPVVLVLPDVSADGLRETDDRERAALRFVHNVGQRIAAAWRSLGGSVAIVEHAERRTRSPWAAAANSRGGVACVCLLPDFAGHEIDRGYRIVGGPAAPLSRPLWPLTGAASAGVSGEAASGASIAGEPLPEFRAWPAVSARHADESEQLAWILLLHLQAAAPSLPVRREQWPMAALRGLDMPGVVLYVGRRGTSSLFPGDEDELTLAQTAEALALAIEAFQMRRNSWRP